MDLSVVVPTLNAREELAGCLDALAEHAPDAELVVVNGPSSDGTTGTVQGRDDVDVLVELADRPINAARNAGIDRATGDTIAFVDHTFQVTDGWAEAVTTGREAADVVTGPTNSQLAGDEAMAAPESRTIAGREVVYVNPGNVAFDSEVLNELDGYDEYLDVGGSRDIAHRLAGNEFDVDWQDGMQTTRQLGADGGEYTTERGWKYRSLSYRLVKNYNLRPTVIRRLISHSGGDAFRELRAVFRGDNRPSEWFGTGRAVVTNLFGGVKDGLGARRRDRTATRNPSGRSSRADRAVTVYDWRE
jgi:glycosyltransferase involved in cell wall biosynthesis